MLILVLDIPFLAIAGTPALADVLTSNDAGGAASVQPPTPDYATDFANFNIISWVSYIYYK